MRPGVLFLALLVLSALTQLPGLLTGPSLDAAVFAEVSREVRDGSTLYMGTWDHKPPGMYLLLASFQVALPMLDAWAVSWITTVVATAAVGMAVAQVGRQIGLSAAAITLAAVAAVLAMGQYLLSLGGGLTEPVAAVPLGVAFALALAPASIGVARGVLIGVLLGAAGMVSPQVAPGALVAGGLAILRAPHSVTRLRVGLLVVAGGIVPAVATVAWLAWTGAMTSALDAVFGYAAAYRAVPSPAPGRLISPVASWTVLSLVFLAVPAVLGAPHAIRRGGLQRAAALAALVWIAASIAFFLYQGRFYGHYAIPLVIPLAVLAGVGIDRVADDARRLRRPAGRALAVLPVVVGLAVSVPAAIASAGMELEQVQALNRSARAVAAAVRTITQPDDRVWVWGNAPLVYLEADRRHATAYPFLYPLTTPGYATEGLIDDVLAQLQASPPAVIVDAGSRAVGEPGFPELLEPRLTALEGRDLDMLDPLRAFVRDRYEPADVVEGWPIYRLRT